jgi:hypothetical protein
MKYWELDDKKLLEKKMYPLLPLQVFKLRSKLEQLKRNSGDVLNAVIDAKKTTELVAKEAKELYDKREITADDLHKVLIAVINIFEYLNRKYGNNELLEEEVKSMTKTLYDQAVEEKGIEKGIDLTIKVIQDLKNGKSIDEISKETSLSIDEINKIKSINI